jgi:hypothetical protein
MNIDAKLLKGFKFRTSEAKEIEEDGRKIKKFFLKERPLAVEDVLSLKDYGDSIVIVTADGQKLTIDKTQKKGE